MTPLLDLTLAEIKEKVASLGDQPFRAKQICECLYSGKDLHHSNVPKYLVNALSDQFNLSPASILTQKSNPKGDTTKFLFQLSDGNIVEGVLMKYSYGNTFCLSCQVGCRMGCAFCASTLQGLGRNLTAGEMLAMVILVNTLGGSKRNITNIVMMGSGEPLDNYENVVQFLNLVTAPDGLGFSSRNISLSTCGLVPQMLTLPNDAPHVTLTLSLHAATDEKRQKIMPIAKAYKVQQTVNALKEYFNQTKRRVAVEYSLIAGLNDSDADAAALVKLLRGFPCHINIINLNSVKESRLTGVNQKQAYAFCDKLTKAGLSATVRKLMGADIDGACGQLRNKFVGCETPASSENKPQ